MKRLLTYLTMLLLALSASANTGSEVIGGEPVVSADWEVQVYPNPSNGVCKILVNGNNSKLNVLVLHGTTMNGKEMKDMYKWKECGIEPFCSDIANFYYPT